MLDLEELEALAQLDVVELDPESEAEQRRAELAERLSSVYLQTSDQLLASAKLEPDWLIPNAVPKGSICFFVGKPGVCKSWLAYDLACAVVQQRDWINFGVPICPPDAKVMILNFDNPHHECGRRFLRLGLRPGDALLTHSFGAHLPPDPLPPVLQLPDSFEPLETLVYYIRPTLIVVDSLRQAHTSDEADSREMAVIMSQLKRMALWGASVIIVHHSRKNDTSMRGSTEIEATADAISDVEREAEVSLLTFRKTRGWNALEPTVSVQVVDEGDRTYVRGGLSLSGLLAEGPVKRSEVPVRLNVGQSAAKKIIDRCLETGLVQEVRDANGNKVLDLSKRDVKEET